MECGMVLSPDTCPFLISQWMGLLNYKRETGSLRMDLSMDVKPGEKAHLGK